MPRHDTHGEPCEGLPFFPDGIERSQAVTALLAEVSAEMQGSRILMRQIAIDEVERLSGLADLRGKEHRRDLTQHNRQRTMREVNARRIVCTLLRTACGEGHSRVVPQLMRMSVSNYWLLTAQHRFFFKHDRAYQKLADDCARAFMGRRSEWSY